MAINAPEEPQFLTINHRESWEEGFLSDVRAGEEGLTLREAHQYRLERTLPLTELAPGFELADAVLGPGRILYLLDSRSKSLYVYDAGQSRTERLECLSCIIKEPERIAYSPRHIYVLDQHAGSSVIQFAEVNGQWIWNTEASRDAAGRFPPELKPLRITDIAAGPDGSLYALDTGQSCIVRIDAGGRITRVFGTNEAAGSQSAAIAVSGDGIVYVLDASKRKVSVYSDSVKIRDFPVEGPASPSCIGLDSEGMIHIGDGGPADAGNEEERFIHQFSPEGIRLGVVSAYRGASHSILFGRSNTMYVLNKESGSLTILVRERTLYKQSNSPLSFGTYFSKSLDSVFFQTKWHELSVDADIPGGSQIEVAYLAADRRTFLIQGAERDLNAYLSDSSVSSDEKVEALNSLPWSQPLLNPSVALMQGVAGRYLWLRIRLIGSDELSPTVKAVSAVFPRDSYLRYLPGIYQEDEAGRSFLERYLSLFERFFADSELAIGQIAKWFDLGSVTGEYLRWLSTWLAVAYDENWPEAKLRLLMQRIPELYRKRGTREGIESMIELFIGEKPFIIEHFHLESAEDEEVKRLLYQLYGSDPYGFCVLLTTQLSSDSYAAVSRILEAEKPAHTNAGLTVLQPWIYLDHHTYLEINSALTKPNSRVGEAVIQRDSVLDDRDRSGYISGKSRVHIDTVLT